MKKIVLAIAALALLSAGVFGQQSGRPGVSLVGVKQTSANEVVAALELSNPTSFQEGLLRISYDAGAMAVAQGEGWQCALEGGRERCLKEVRVSGSERAQVRLLLKKYFDGEFVFLSYEIPEAGNARVDNQFLLTHTRNPGEISAETLTLVALALLALGVLAWGVSLKAREMQAGAGVLSLVGSFADANHFLLAVMGNAALALGLMLLAAPQFGVASATIFSLAFAFGFLALSHFRHLQAEERERGPRTLTEITEEEARLNELLRATRIKYMRKEIDDATFKKLVADLELELLKLEEREKRMREKQGPPSNAEKAELMQPSSFG